MNFDHVLPGCVDDQFSGRHCVDSLPSELNFLSLEMLQSLDEPPCLEKDFNDLFESYCVYLTLFNEELASRTRRYGSGMIKQALGIDIIVTNNHFPHRLQLQIPEKYYLNDYSVPQVQLDFHFDAEKKEIRLKITSNKAIEPEYQDIILKILLGKLKAFLSSLNNDKSVNHYNTTVVHSLLRILTSHELAIDVQLDDIEKDFLREVELRKFYEATKSSALSDYDITYFDPISYTYICGIGITAIDQDDLKEYLYNSANSDISVKTMEVKHTISDSIALELYKGRVFIGTFTYTYHPSDRAVVGFFYPQKHQQVPYEQAFTLLRALAYRAMQLREENG